MHRFFRPQPTLAALLGLALAMAAPAEARAEMRPSLNLNGVSGLIDMPSGVSMPDGALTGTFSNFGPITRSTVTFQFAPRFSGSFRYVGIEKWNDRFCPPDCSGANGFETYFDRNFDVSMRLLDETRYLPSVTIGLQDFIGTGLNMAEYVAATKTFNDRLRVTAGLGFGRLASHGAIATPFGPRPDIDFGQGGVPNFRQWFRGPMAPFGGVEYQIGDRLTLKAEYSSDAYTREARVRDTFDYRSPMNYGVEYQMTPSLRLGGYSISGSELGFSVNLMLNPKERRPAGMRGTAPLPITPRRPQDVANPQTGWLTQPDVGSTLIDNLNLNLERTGILVDSVRLEGDRVQVRYRNTIYDAPAQAAGRLARAMARVMPSSVEVFEMVPMVRGMAASKLVVNRSDLERLEFAPDQDEALRANSDVQPVRQRQDGLVVNEATYPDYSWGINPYSQVLLFDPRQPLQYNLGAELRGTVMPVPGIVLSGSLLQGLVSRMEGPRGSGAGEPLPPVRSQLSRYYNDTDLGLGTLTAAWYGKLAPELYGRVTAGYLEMMYGGVSAEVLWKPVDGPLALGLEANYVSQRNTDGGFGFDQFDYQVFTGHASAYVDLGRDYAVRLDVGRYLAGDVGATLSVMRTFENGWQVGAYATLTDVSAEQFGEGSFDKGLTFRMPLSWLTGYPTRASRGFTLQPLGRDGGARLAVRERLYDTLRGTEQEGMDLQWSRFWK